jgi:hypothetical protein
VLGDGRWIVVMWAWVPDARPGPRFRALLWNPVERRVWRFSVPLVELEDYRPKRDVGTVTLRQTAVPEWVRYRTSELLGISNAA